MAQGAKTPPAAQETEETSVQSLGQKDPLEKGRAWQPTPGRENPIDREAWWTTDHKTQTGFSQEIANRQHGGLSPIPVLSLAQF